MGLHINIYKDDGIDCTLNGVSSRKIKGLCITNIENTPFEPCDDYPPVKLVSNPFNSVVLVPEECEGEWTMFGGNYGATSDSRFSDKIEEITGHRFYGAIPIHDRVEGWV